VGNREQPDGGHLRGALLTYDVGMCGGRICRELQAVRPVAVSIFAPMSFLFVRLVVGFL
jgi:hypothetical protein